MSMKPQMWFLYSEWYPVIFPWQGIGPVRHTHTYFLLRSSFILFFHLSISLLVALTSLRIMSQWLLVWWSWLIPVRASVCVCSKVGRARENHSSVSEWRRGSGCAASPWASCCVPSFSLTATEGIAFRMCWREENSCPRSVPLCCQRTWAALKKLHD